MQSIKCSVLTVLAALSLGLAAPAQGQLDVPDSLTAGFEAVISYTNPDRAGEMIMVDIEGEDSEGDQLLIWLDDDGYGEETWMVPEWEAASFSAPEAAPAFRLIGGVEN